MKKLFTRAELYELVWSKPIKAIAPDFNISDVALSKICRKHGIPKPPRGYWAKLNANKPVIKAALSKRELGMPELIELKQVGRAQVDAAEELVVPPALTFDESQAELVARVDRMVGRVPVPRDLRNGHRHIKKLLEQDDERQKNRLGRGYLSGFDSPLFESPYEKRRLRIVNAIFLKLNRCGVQTTARGKDPKSFEFKVGEQHLTFSVDHSSVQRHGWRDSEDANRLAKAPMQFAISAYPKPSGVCLKWGDESDKKLENRLAEIVTTMVVVGEMQYRAGEERQRQFLIERRTRLAEEKKSRDRAEQELRATNLQLLEDAKVQRLLADANAYQQASAIRAYVAAARTAGRREPQEITADQTKKWADWALAEADRIDPVVNRHYLVDWEC